MNFLVKTAPLTELKEELTSPWTLYFLQSLLLRPRCCYLHSPETSAGSGSCGQTWNKQSCKVHFCAVSWMGQMHPPSAASAMLRQVMTLRWQKLRCKAHLERDCFKFVCLYSNMFVCLFFFLCIKKRIQ